MPDPLDPVDSFYSGIRSAFVAFGGVPVVSLCGHALGVQVALIGQTLAGGGTASSLLAFWKNFDVAGLLTSWAGVFADSVTTWWGAPFLLLYIWLLARLRSGYEMRTVLFIVAVTQPIHTFIALAQASSPTSTELLIGVALLAISVAGLALLLVWWKRVFDEHERAASEGELEL